MLRVDCERTPDGGFVVCTPAGELESYTVTHFREAMARLKPGDRLVIDLSGVTFVDSAGLGALIGGIRRTRELGGEVVVSCKRPAILRLLRTTGFDRIVSLVETQQEALIALSPADAPSTEARPAKAS